MPEAVIIDCLRTPVGKAPRGTLKNTRPDDLAALVIDALLKKYPNIPVDEIDDVILGCANPEAESGMNMARIAAMRAGQRAQAILGLIGGAWLALIVLAVAPPWAKVLALFVNGLCLGMIWGLVFAYMEGRRTSELLGALLCASFIVSSTLSRV